MREILNKLNIPKEMSVILRTAGGDKTKLEIKRDYDYLFKLWQEIKSKTLKSIAPLLIHEENHIIKRAIRDNFSNDLNFEISKPKTTHLCIQQPTGISAKLSSSSRR